MSTIKKYEKGKTNRDFWFPSPNNNLPLDFWHENIFYGRINRESDAICLKDSALKQVPSEQGTIFAANFVVDAYKDFRKYCRKAAAHGKIISGGMYGTLHALKGWQSPSSLYHSHMQTIFENFASSYLAGGKRRERILSFKGFIKQFLNYVAVLTPKVPVTKTAFMLSRYCPPHVSGLIIELDNKNILRNDLDKKRKFTRDPNFHFFRNAAKKFGFYIDKNAPWTLVANIFSSGKFKAQPLPSQSNFAPTTVKTGMSSYLEEYGLTSNDVFDILYFKVFEGDDWVHGVNGDIELLKTYLLQFYNTLLAAEPYVHKSSVCVGTNQVKTIIKKIKRQEIGQITEDGDLPYMYVKKFGNMFWLRTFLNIRMLEQQLGHNFNDIFLESKYILERDGFKPALNLINDKTNGFRRTTFNRKGKFWQGYSTEEKNLNILNQKKIKELTLPSLPKSELIPAVAVSTPLPPASAAAGTGGSSGY